VRRHLVIRLQRFVSGGFNDRDSLEYFIQSLRPISETDDLHFLENMEGFDILKLKSFFYSFWLERNSEQPEAAWLEYHSRVLIANELFTTNLKEGFDTDMGRVYLKYGKPASIHADLQPADVWPYHIWHYTDTDARFVFYAPSMVQAEFFLLHSNLIEEIRNPQWVGEMYGARGNTNYQDLSQKENDHFLKELFNNPRNNFSLFE